ncbi:MAG: MFS transporter [Ardenticatenaceae bacterium]|nr:MFS transporter [Ardenticatenaceae bacterium]
MDRKRIIPIFAVVFTNILGAGVILPILPLLAEGEFQATALQATTLSAVFFAAQFVAAPWLGRISDRVGRRPVLIVSQIGTVLSFILFIFAAPLGRMIDGWGISLGITGGLFMLYVARLLDGITGGNITTAQAYIADVSTPQTRAQALGMISAAFGLGFIFGPAFGGFLAGINLVAPFVGAAIITSGSVLLTIFMLTESLPPEARAAESDAAPAQSKIPTSQFLRQPNVFRILVIAFVVTLAFAALQSTFALYAERVIFPELSHAQVARNTGLILAAVGVTSVITQLFFIKSLVQRLGEFKVAILGQISLSIAFIGLSSISSPPLAALFIVPLAFGNSVNEPNLQAILTRNSDGRTRGRLLGLYQSARSLALIFGPIWAGYTFQTIGPRAPFAIAAPVVLVAIALTILLQRRDISAPAT